MRLVAQMKRLREVVTAILALADELKERTIEKVMAKSDAYWRPSWSPWLAPWRREKWLSKLQFLRHLLQQRVDLLNGFCRELCFPFQLYTQVEGEACTDICRYLCHI